MNKTRFTNVEADGFYGEFNGEFNGSLNGHIIGAVDLGEKGSNYSLDDDEKVTLIKVTPTASINLTLGMKEGQVCIVINGAGATHAVTVKNVSSDVGTLVAAGKTAIIGCSETANNTIVKVI